MSPKGSKGVVASPHEAHGYEFLGPPGAFAISFGLPIACYAATFLCNDISGCPVPSALSPSTLTVENLKRDVGWPANGIMGLASWDATLKTLGYYALSLVLHRVLPGEEVEGVELSSGGRLKYKFNTWWSSLTTFAILAAGTAAQGADFPVWTYIYDNYLQILTANILIAYGLATYVYIKSFSVKPGNVERRELAMGGQSGNMLYDWFIGRELNPRVTLPIFGEIDIKEWCELRPGMMGWIILNFTFMAHQYKAYGVITDSIFLVTAFQTLYVFDAWWMESAILTTMDITTDGFGFMLAFGDLVWVPFIYSIQARYLAVYPHSLGLFGCAQVFAVLGTGYYIFRSANNEKNRFRTNPKDPRVAHLKYIETKSGSKLLTSGWWGTARHINYTGDWIQAWAYCMPTGIAGYLIQHSSIAPTAGQSLVDKSFVYNGPVAYSEVTQGSARGWGMMFTYFYLVYFAILLVHRERRDEEKCIRKYGDDWKKYTEAVPYRMIPGIY
ncbi:Delta(14)-sterol reductase [Glarea lozoyensis ATCC 20868]|uniref:Delta(14)-sterol reductase n=1 Tax=Glarea lozoyensis (strain ATCC 20868 / MF5171) TaxID=1116229 RepID=S3DK69_GLAL2|nr:Delta(14)-sterol reductase [Glarea lozoyensis ATCC 20868]EPE32456.1 Delta(14)-sterol reductase [Glarea lozoyensis ATCC 20868]